jgi:hypothetical protein
MPRKNAGIERLWTQRFLAFSYGNRELRRLRTMPCSTEAIEFLGILCCGPAFCSSRYICLRGIAGGVGADPPRALNRPGRHVRSHCAASAGSLTARKGSSVGPPPLYPQICVERTGWQSRVIELLHATRPLRPLNGRGSARLHANRLHPRNRSCPGVAPRIPKCRQPRKRIAAINPVMHEKPLDKRAHSHTCRFFPSAMLLGEISSAGHHTLAAKYERIFV